MMVLPRHAQHSDGDAEDASKKSPLQDLCRRRRGLAIAICVLWTLLSMLLLRFAVDDFDEIISWIQGLPQWVRERDKPTLLLLLAAIVFVDAIPAFGHLFAKAVQLALPFTFALPTAVGLLLCVIFSSCMFTFFVGRRLCHPFVRWLVAGHAWLGAIDSALLRGSHDGMRLAVLFRLLPLPEVLSSYLLSTTAVRVRDYAIASAAEAVKSTLITLYIDFNLQQGFHAFTQEGGVDWLTVGLLAGAAVVVSLLLRTLYTAIKAELLSARGGSEPDDSAQREDLLPY